LRLEPSTSESSVPAPVGPVVERRRGSVAWVPPALSVVVVVLAIGTHWAQAETWVTAELVAATRTDRGGPARASALSAAVQIAELPPAGYEEARAPLGRPQPLASAGTSFAFTSVQSDGTTPVTWDPCRPVHYVVRAEGRPEGGDRLIADAVAAVSAATGLRFVDDGSTDESPSARRSIYQPERYGERWAPVLVAWMTPAEQPEFEGPATGLAGPTIVSIPGTRKIDVSGVVELDATQIPQVLRREGRAAADSLVAHEFGHLVGLAHVDDPTQVMNPVSSGRVTSFADGDLTGLHALGLGSCVPEL
jgi:hypothetical protein